MFFSLIFVVFFTVFQIANNIHAFRFHASCEIEWTIPVGCNEIKDQLINQMNVWNDDSNCGTVSPTCPELPCGQNCLYKYLSVDDDGTLRGKHATPVKRYNDSISFQFNSLTANSCKIDAYSTSDLWYAVLDFGTNYCNLRNLLDGTGLSDGNGFVEKTSNADCTQYEDRDCTRY